MTEQEVIARLDVLEREALKFLTAVRQLRLDMASGID